MGENGLVMEDRLEGLTGKDELGECSELGLKEVGVGEEWGVFVLVWGSLAGAVGVSEMEGGELRVRMGPRDCRERFIGDMVNDELRGLQSSGNSFDRAWFRYETHRYF
jgi:hypothetical protein